jgi:tripartite-type tricarboxylate transporter receptor subunit TctC
VTAALLALAPPVFGAQAASSYPTKPVRIVAPFPTGGTADLLARMLADHLSQKWTQQAIVDNRSGAGGVIGTEIVAKATPDGYTLLMAAIGHAANPALYAKLPYDTLRDFAPIALIADVPLVIAVNPKLSAKSVKELIALAKARPGQLNFAAGGVGASSHWAGALFESLAKIQWQTVQYKGGGPSLIAVLGGEGDLTFSPLPSSINHLKAGRLRAIAITSPKRVPQLPDVPTIAESGLPSYDFRAWYGMFAPAAVPKPILARLNTDFNAALNDPKIRSTMIANGAEPLGGTREEFAQMLPREIRKYATVAKQAGIKAR